MSILDQILSDQKKLVELNKQRVSIKMLQQKEAYTRPCISLKRSILENKYPAIIAEFKRRSPSKPNINVHADISTVPLAYENAGASAISILTNEKYFGGFDEDIISNRKHITIPILRKEFIVDAYQIHEAKAMGADMILLIAEALEKEECKELTTIAKDLGLEVLLELHAENEIDKIYNGVDFVGINNRNLKNFETTIQASMDMIGKLPSEVIKVSESGISSAEEIVTLYNAGYKAFLIGESFMKYSNPGAACEAMNDEVKILFDLNKIAQ